MLHKNFNLIFLVDTGASVSLIKNSSLRHTIINSAQTVNVIGISGKSFKTLGSVKCKLRAHRFKSTIEFQVLPDDNSLRVDGILGADFLSKHAVDICYSNNTLFINNCKARLPLLRSDTIQSTTLTPRSLSYVDIFTTHNEAVYVKNKKLSNDIYLIGCIQKPKCNKLTMV